MGYYTKVAYAVFCCCKTLHSPISDRKFTIMSDHRNLPCLKGDLHSVILCCANALSELDFTLGFIAGTNNIIADHIISCENDMLETPSAGVPPVSISASVVESI